MPYQVYRNGDEYCVHKKNPDGSKGKKINGGCHSTESDAQDHMAALYANEKEWLKAAKILQKIIS